MTATPSDESLALQIQQGNEDALPELVARHLDPLTGYLYRLASGDRLLAEDLAQETFLQVIRHIDQYSHPRPFKPWLYAIATNLARNYYDRADTRRTMARDEEEWESMHDPGTAAEQRIEQSDAADLIREVLDGLPGHQREVIILRYVHEFSLDEIAGTLGIPIGTVKSRLSLGLRALRTLVEVQAL